MRATVSQLDINRAPRVDPSDLCDCGEALNRDGECFRCDRCHCQNVDKGTGYMECLVHERDVRPVGDLMAALKTAMGMGK